MKNPSVTKKHQGSCGDILFLSLKLNEDYIQDAAYEYIGCAGLQVCTSAMTEMVKGNKIRDVRGCEVEDIFTYLEGIPEQKHECAEISPDILRKAIDKWQKARLIKMKEFA